jgi:hypothetical protein
MRRVRLTEDEAGKIMASGGIPPEIRGASAAVAVILTQSWCPQWRAMDGYLGRMEGELSGGPEELTVFHLCYDLLPFAGDFTAFKEKCFENDQIPFVLYYRNAEPSETSNYVSEDTFRALARL